MEEESGSNESELRVIGRVQSNTLLPYSWILSIYLLELQLCSSLYWKLKVSFEFGFLA